MQARPIVAALALLAAVSQADAQERRPAAPGAEAYYQFVLGRHYEAEGDIERAIAALEAAARLDPRSAEVPAELASLYARQGRFQEAVVVAESALKIDPASVEAHRVLGSVFASMAESASGEGTAPALGRAIAHLEQARGRRGADPEASVDLLLGRLYLQNGDYQKAEAVLSTLIVDQPEVGEAYALLARAEIALGQTDRAIAILEAASLDNPRLLTMLASVYERERRWGDAAGAYARASAMNPSSLDVKTRWATVLLNQPDPAAARQARDLLRDVTAAVPTDIRPLYLLSTAERRAGDLDQAAAAARRVSALDPNGWVGPYALALVHEERHQYPAVVETLAPVATRFTTPGSPVDSEAVAVFLHLGIAQLQIGRPDDAVHTFERASALAAEPAVVEGYLVQANLAARRYDRAVEVARKARAARPFDLRLTELEARALAGRGDADEASALLRQAVEKRPDAVSLPLALADILSDAGRGAEAEAVLTTAARRFPDDPSVAFTRGATRERRKDYAGAEAAFRELLARDPKHAPALNYLGYMLADRNDRVEEALALIERALGVDPDNAAYLDSLGWACYRLKRYAEASVHLARAAEQLPGNSVVQDHYGDLLMAQGRVDQAMAAWQQAIDGDRDLVDVAAIEAKVRRARSSAAR